eukprot:scaffold106491_cov74-Cyclotella_meneghiniana.AAC.1
MKGGVVDQVRHTDTVPTHWCRLYVAHQSKINLPLSAMQLNYATLWLSHILLVYARKDDDGVSSVHSDGQENTMLKTARIIGGEAVSAANNT